MKTAVTDRKRVFPTVLAFILAALFAWVVVWRIPDFASFGRNAKMLWFGGVFLALSGLLLWQRQALFVRFSQLFQRKQAETPLQASRLLVYGMVGVIIMILFVLHSDYFDVWFPHEISIENTSSEILSITKICPTDGEDCFTIDHLAAAQGILSEDYTTRFQPGQSLSFRQNFFFPPTRHPQAYFVCTGGPFTASIGTIEKTISCGDSAQFPLQQGQPISRSWLLIFALNAAALFLASILLAFLLVPVEILNPQKIKSFRFHTFILVLIVAAFGVALAVELTKVPGQPPLTGLSDVFDWEGTTLSFNSYLTYLFIGLVLVLYYLVKPAARWLVLLTASYIFLFSFDPAFPVLLLAVTALSYRSARRMSASDDGEAKKKVFNRGALGILGILLFFKYAPLLWSSAGVWFGAPDVWRRILLPAGLSFYSFTALSYLKDVQTGKIAAENHFGKFALYLAYFPKLLIGPIERPKAFLTQLEEAHPFDDDRFVLALSRIGLGLFKRLLVSNRLAVIADTTFANPQNFSSPELVIGLLAFSLQVYIDFSAYTDIAIGISSLFGIRLSENFQQPYFAVSVVDFWRRWHISFSSWLRDYVFLPLEFETRRIRTKAMQYVNTLLTFFISGMWHGATLNFLLWGGMHGVYQVGEDILAGKREEKSTTNAVTQISKVLFTFVLVSLAWVWFRADTFQLAVDYFESMFNIHTLFQFSAQAFLLDVPDFWLVIGLLPVMLLLELIQRRHDLLAEIYAQPLLLRWAIYLFAIFAMVIFGYYGSYDIDFVYMQF